MKRFVLARVAALMVLCLALTACGKGDDDGAADDTAGVAQVTTVMPVWQTFHDRVAAWGNVVADPHRERTLSLAHGGQVVALEVSAGQTVKRGQPLLTVAPDPAARSAYQQAQSAATLAEGELKRTEQLAAQHLATASQVATARKALADAQSALAAQRALGGGAAQETVAAPDDGVVTTLSVTLGDRFAANAPLLVFIPAHALIAALGVQPDAGAALRVGMPVSVQGVYGDAKAFAGKLTMVGRAIDPQSHLLPVQADLPAAAAAALVAGSPLEATIQSGAYTAWAVPRAAVLHDNGAHDSAGAYLYQIDHGKAHRVDVELRHPAGDTVGVEGKLDPKLPVIVQGAYEVDDGAAVRQGDSPAGSEPKP
ncbi:MAG: efflux RND transporter periplasmic adaptor subunit [Proteobacteria bacterium]|nr:efflux RND transporter periplasmic adaptor subunit [Pseudomonadota bacterium]